MYMTPKVPSSETVTHTLGIRVAPPLCRKKATTPTTSTTEMARVRSTSAREARMVTERSMATSTLTSAGRASRRAGRRFFT